MERTGIYRKGFLRVIGVLCVFGIAGYLFQTNNLRAESAVSKEIAKEIQKIKDAGEPTTIEELVPPDMPDSENGTLVYNQAFNLLNELRDKYQEEWKYFPYEGAVKWTAAPVAAKEKVRNLFLNNPDFAKFYQLLEKASGMKCQFKKRKDYEKGAAMLLPHLASLRSCARMLVARADIQAEKGEIDNALHDCLTCLKISDSPDEPILIAGLVRVVIDQIALAGMEEIMWRGNAKSETYQALMKEVMRIRNDKIMYRGLLGERVIFSMIEFANLKKQVEEKGIEPLFESLSVSKKKERDLMAGIVGKDPVGFMEENELTYLQTMVKVIAFSELPYPEAREKYDALNKELVPNELLPDKKAVLTEMLVPALTRAFLQETRIDAQLGNAEIALACHLYKAKNKNYPVFLKELSLEFLEKLPFDPFTGRDYIYNKDGNGFSVYSLGENLKDDGGRWGEPPNKWETGDIVWAE